ncbi:MAG: ABC transporter permease [Gemmatimonadales bacterium]|nr:ABC transporter permease [Gemmatimonadales bacterium]
MMGLLRKLGALIARRRYEAELDEEWSYHVEREAERYRDAGLDPAAAHTAARRSLGNLTLARESIRSTWGWPRLDELRQDLLFALRSFRREPALVATVVLTIGLGVGLNTAFFTIFNAYVLRPFPVSDPASLYQVRWHTRDQAGYSFSWQQYLDLAQQTVAREQLGYRYLVTRVDGQTTRVMMTTGNYFGMLGVGAALGRVLSPADAEAGGTSVGVLSHDTWRQRFGADPGIIGRTVLVRGQPVEIVGVARAGFDGIDDNSPDLWIPITMVARLEPGLAPFGVGDAELVQVILRFRPGIAAETGRAALSDWLARDTESRPEPQRVIAAAVVSKETAQPLTPSVLLAVVPVFLAFGLVLLAACANVASAMIARGIARRDEIGVRLALGAGRARVVRQLLTESLLLALPAALAGIMISRLVLAGVTWFIAATVPDAFKSFIELAPVDPDYRVLLFAAVSAVLCALGFGLIPALQATRPGAVRSPVGMVSSSGGRPSRLRQGLLVAQIAIATLLLVVTGVLLGATQRIPARDIGIDPSGVVVIDLDDRFRAAGLLRLRDDPAVRAMAATDRVPLESSFLRVGLTGSDQAIVAAGAARVSGGFFEVLSHRILAGRTFLDDESRNDVSGGDRQRVGCARSLGYQQCARSNAPDRWPRR